MVKSAASCVPYVWRSGDTTPPKTARNFPQLGPQPRRRRCGHDAGASILKERATFARHGAFLEIVDGWRKHFRQCGVSKGDIEALAEQIDRPFLRDQRNELTH